jgi:hypothetical protein
MRRLLAWIACGAGALFFFRRRLLRRKPEAAGSDPAEELRRKLDETRAEEPATPPAADEAEPAAGLDERRSDVHERGRAAIDRMRGDSSPT